MDFLILNSLIGILLMFGSMYPLFQSKGVSRFALFVGVLLTLALSVNHFLDLYELPYQVTTPFLSLSHYEWLFLICMDVCFLIYLLFNVSLIEDLKRPLYEQFVLFFFIRTGCVLIISYNNLLMLFLGLEMISFPLYILTGIQKKQLKSNEAAIKYLLLGALSSCILLMGVTLMYGATGTFYLSDMVSTFSQHRVLFQMGLVFVFISMAFKVSAAPFHFWTPDIYEGAPTVYTSLMASIVKSFFLLSFLRLLSFDWGELKQVLSYQVLTIITLTLLIGNFTAVFQQGLKRLMAYSSISQVGFMLLALFGTQYYAHDGLFLYTISYTITSISIFFVLSKGSNHSLENLKGLGHSHPFIAFCLTIYFLSLAGIPLTVGFLSKYYMLIGALQNQLPFYMIVIVIVSSTVSLFYYMRLIQNMYFKERTLEGSFFHTDVSFFHQCLLLLTALMVLVLGVSPDLLLHWLNY